MGADHHPRRRQPCRRVGGHRQAKVADLRHAFGGELDVSRLDVAVDDAFAVRKG